MNKILVYFFFEDFFHLNNGIAKIHYEFISKEHEETVRRKKNAGGGSENSVVFGEL
jgi:hypothetical protein